MEALRNLPILLSISNRLKVLGLACLCHPALALATLALALVAFLHIRSSLPMGPCPSNLRLRCLRDLDLC